jgi:integrase/recombinase XerD
MSPKTLLNYEPDLARGALMFPDKAIDELTGADLLHIATSFPPKSRRVRMSTWKSFYKWARRTRRVTVDPTDELPEIKRNPQPVIRVFNDVEIEALLQLPVIDAAPLAVLLEAGLRKAEASSLRLQDCMPESGQVIVLNGKGGRDRIIPMSARLQHLLNELILLERLRPQDHVFYAVKANQHDGRKILRGKPVGEATFARWWRRCLDDAGVTYRTPHTARHTFATRWRLRGLGIDDLQILLGHSSINTTASIYVHTRIRDVEERMRAIEASEV